MEKFDDEFGDLSGYKILSFEEVKQGFIGNKDPFEGIRTNKTFEEISNEIAMSTPFGKDSVFYRELREIITGQMPKI